MHSIGTQGLANASIVLWLANKVPIGLVFLCDTEPVPQRCGEISKKEQQCKDVVPLLLLRENVVLKKKYGDKFCHYEKCIHWHGTLAHH